MNLLGGLFGGGGEQLAKPIDAVASGLDKLFTSDDERLSRAEAMERLKQQPGELLNELEKIYAQSSSIFVAGGRPFCLWIAGFTFGHMGIAVVWFGKTVPEWFAEASVTGLLGALGLYGFLRTVEKITGKAK